MQSIIAFFKKIKGKPYRASMDACDEILKILHEENISSMMLKSSPSSKTQWMNAQDIQNAEKFKKIKHKGKLILKSISESKDRWCIFVTQKDDRFVIQIDPQNKIKYIKLKINANNFCPMISNASHKNRISSIIEEEKSIPQGISRPVEQASAHEILEADPPIFICKNTSDETWNAIWNAEWHVFRDGNNIGVFSIPKNKNDVPVTIGMVCLDAIK